MILFDLMYKLQSLILHYFSHVYMAKFLQSSLIGLIQMVHEMAKEIEDIKREASSLITDQEVIYVT